MADPDPVKAEEKTSTTLLDTTNSYSHSDAGMSTFDSAPTTPGIEMSSASGLSRSPSFSEGGVFQDDDNLQGLPPLDRLTIFDFLENLALPQRLEKLQNEIASKTDKIRKQQQNARKRVVDEWRKRVPTPADEQFSKYQKRVKKSVDKVNRRWTNANTVTLREKVSFIAGVLNIFISGYLVGAFPEYFHWWYTAQLAYFYPIRFITYHKRGYHYFLVDLCYFVNLLLLLSIWVFPQSKRLFISTFCLAFGNNAIAIAMWRNSLVFHSLDKVTSLFIHIMPCVTMHCLVHLIPKSVQQTRFPAIYDILYSEPGAPEHYSLASMIVWSTLPYAAWQLTYHFLITVRRREKIAAGRPTSFTWLRKSYSKTYIGKFVLNLPEAAQEPAFMLIQYSYALLTMMPAPLWFWSRWASAGFLMAVFTWSIYNGAVYYIDVFGQRVQKELDQLKKDVAQWQTSPSIGPKTPLLDQGSDQTSYGKAGLQDLSLGEAADGKGESRHLSADSTSGSATGGDDYFKRGSSTGVNGSGNNEVRNRNKDN